jgi:hypothetical protein
MLMPKAAVHKNHLALWPKDEIRLSGKVVTMEAIAVAQRMDKFPNQ